MRMRTSKYVEPCGLPPGSLLNTALTIASMPTRHSLNALCIATEAEIKHLPLRSLRFLPLLYSLNLIIPIYSLLLPNLAKMALYIINSCNVSITRVAFSSSKLTISDHRCRLDIDTIQAIECLKSWRKIKEFEL